MKYGVIADGELFEFLEKRMPALLRRDADALSYVIQHCIRVKTYVVCEDEHEGGLRQILNFGHTLGHALEAVTGYRRFLHGEAIGWGMMAATLFALATNRIREKDASRILRLIASVGPLPPLGKIEASQLRRDSRGRQESARAAASFGSCRAASGRRSGAPRFPGPSSRERSPIFLRWRRRLAVKRPVRRILQIPASANSMPMTAQKQAPLPGTRPAGTHDEREASARVREMFSRIAPRYDFLNHLLSFSLDHVWRRRTANRFAHILRRPDARVLDLCCGTGDLAFALAKKRKAAGVSAAARHRSACGAGIGNRFCRADARTRRPEKAREGGYAAAVLPRPTR